MATPSSTDKPMGGTPLEAPSVSRRWTVSAKPLTAEGLPASALREQALEKGGKSPESQTKALLGLNRLLPSPMAQALLPSRMALLAADMTFGPRPVAATPEQTAPPEELKKRGEDFDNKMKEFVRLRGSYERIVTPFTDDERKSVDDITKSIDQMIAKYENIKKKVEADPAYKQTKAAGEELAKLNSEIFLRTDYLKQVLKPRFGS